MSNNSNLIYAQYVAPYSRSRNSIVLQKEGTTKSPWTGFPTALISTLLFLGILGVVAVYFLKKVVESLQLNDQKENGTKGVIFEVKVPQGNEVEIGVAEKMFANLYSISKPNGGIFGILHAPKNVSFEIVALPGAIRFFVYADRKIASIVEKQILGSYQDADIRVVDDHNIFKAENYTSFAELELAKEPYYPLRTFEDFKGDPITNVLSTVSKLDDGEGIIIQYVLTPAGKDWQKLGEEWVKKKNEAPKDKDATPKYVDQDKVQAVKKKISKIGFKTSIRVIASSSSQELADMHVNSVLSAFSQYNNPGINELKKKKIGKSSEHSFIEDVVYRRISPSNKMVLNSEELATIFHFPNKEVTVPNISWLLARDFPAANWISSDINSKDTIWVGNNIFRGVVKPICFKRDDRRRHSYILGQTGSGKSWLLTRMIIQDIYNGDGVAFIDPHGSTAEMILERIPPERIEDVIYFNVGDYERPIGFNIMEFRNEQDKHRIINGFLGLLKKLYDPNNQGIVGPILERTVRNAMLTAMSEEGSTLVEVLRIVTDEKWVKEKWLPLIKDKMVKRFWTDEVQNTNSFHKSEKLGYVTSKFDAFVTNLAIRNIIGQSKSSFDMRQIMDEGKILIVNLSKGLIGEENMKFLGALLIPRMVSAILSREDIPEDQRRDFYFYVDEFQNFATDEFAIILSEARKYRMSLTVANQYIGQMDDNVKEAIFGNVGSLFIARTGPEDAEFLEKQFAPTITAKDLVNQPNIHWYVKMLVDGKYPTPFSLDTRYGPKYPESGFDIPVYEKSAELIKEISRFKYGRDVKLVTEEINKRSKL